ncbi:MAG TPA: cysteine dioxygenase family protein [Pseudonocardiaceae bacterium]|nr:cysteine dioxygenase family protein [Pseudonocardiaceae bacterium]
MFAVPANTVALPAALGHPARIALDVARDRGRWADLLRYDPDERFATLVDATGDVEIWLLTWLPGQHTDLHHHAGSAGAFTVVSGVLTETVGAIEHLVTVGRTRVFGPGYVHRVRNLGTDPVASIHVYRPERAHSTVER